MGGVRKEGLVGQDRGGETSATWARVWGKPGVELRFRRIRLRVETRKLNMSNPAESWGTHGGKRNIILKHEMHFRYDEMNFRKLETEGVERANEE